MSKFKDQTGNTPLSSSGGNTEESEPQSKPLVSSDTTPISTQIMKKPSPPTLPTEKSEATTVTTPPKALLITEKTRQHAMLAKVALKNLEKAGLTKRYKVLSKDESGATTLREIRIVFDPAIWTEELELR